MRRYWRSINNRVQKIRLWRRGCIPRKQRLKSAQRGKVSAVSLYPVPYTDRLGLATRKKEVTPVENDEDDDMYV